MNWRAKSLTIALVEKMPFSERIYYLLQRFVTRSIPRSAASIESVVKHEQRHLESFRKFTGRAMPEEIFEFGAGWDLCGAVVRHGLGAPRQRMVDLNRLASAWQINHVIAHLAERTNGDIEPTVFRSLEDFEVATGISYSAPFDARDTGYADDCIDLIVSTNTLEHIPVGDIRAILAECRRILRPDGIMSMKIDYSDHYSHADASIGPYNFLQFSEVDWQTYNHSNHYQSRLRHCDYASLFRDSGFTTLHEEAWLPEGPATLPPLNDHFKTYDRAELLPTEGYFVLAKTR